jgi:hypothetical protein
MKSMLKRCQNSLLASDTMPMKRKTEKSEIVEETQVRVSEKVVRPELDSPLKRSK